MTPEELKEWMEKATYQELFDLWSSEPIGSPIHRGELGRVYLRLLLEREPKRAPSAEPIKVRKKK